MAENIDDCIAIAVQATEDCTLTVAGLTEIGTWLEGFLATVTANLGPGAQVVQDAQASADQAATALANANALLPEIERLGERLAAQK